jgi:N-acetylglucosaminyldiphosphoundecaprenol N-acetyl-beta-D-mannosaminyltransferase
MRVKIIDTYVDATSYAQVCDRLEHWIAEAQSIFIVAANVHVLMTAHWQKSYQIALEQASLITPDGMPLVWAMKLLGIKDQRRVYGPDLMLAVCDRATQKGYGIYLYGSTEPTLELLAQKLKQKFPKLIISGKYAPAKFPIVDNLPELTDLNSDLERINQSDAKIIFIGLGCPKQEYWMAAAKGKLNGVAIGVGAAFDFHSGRVSQAPRWLMAIGLEWLYRLIQEPQRLWQRYLIQNPLFLFLFVKQLIKQFLNPIL